MKMSVSCVCVWTCTHISSMHIEWSVTWLYLVFQILPVWVQRAYAQLAESELLYCMQLVCRFWQIISKLGGRLCPPIYYSARLGSWPFFTQLETKNRPETSWNFDFFILSKFFSKIGLKMINLCTMIYKL